MRLAKNCRSKDTITTMNLDTVPAIKTASTTTTTTSTRMSSSSVDSEPSTPETLHFRLHSSLQSQQLLRQQLWQLQQDNLALRELCCFLHEDRLKARRAANEWRRFGEHTSNVMRSEVSHYQTKLEMLDAKQTLLMEDNRRLKDDSNKNSKRKNIFDCPACGDHLVAINASSQANASEDSCYSSSTENSSFVDGVSCSDPESNAKARLVMDVFDVANEQLNEEHVAAEKAILIEMCNVVWRSLET